jgi:hypothetical protein
MPQGNKPSAADDYNDNVGTMALGSTGGPVEGVIGQQANAPTTEWLLNTDEAAKYLGLSPHTLAKWRSTGAGPPFQLLGRRCLYAPETLRAWSAGKVRRSTSDPGMPAER